MRKNERSKMLLRTNPWANMGGKMNSSKPAGKYKLVQPQEEVQKGGMGPVVISPKENRQDEGAIVLAAIQQSKVNSSNNSKKGTACTNGHRSLLFKKWSRKKPQQEDENAKLLQQQSNDKDPRQSKLRQSSSRDSVGTNATKDSSKGGGSTSIWTYRSRDALNMSVVRSSHSKDAIKRSQSKDSSIAATSSRSTNNNNNRDGRVAKNASEESMEKWKKKNNDNIWIGRGKDTLNKSVVRSSRSRDELKTSVSKKSSKASSSNRTNKDNKLTKNVSEEAETRKNDDDDDDDLAHSTHLLIVQKRKSAWIRNMKYFQAEQASKLDVDSRCDTGECRNQPEDRAERDLEEQQQPSADELGIFALKRNAQSSPSLSYNKPDYENNTIQASTLTKEEVEGGGNTTDDNFDGVHGLALAMAAAMDGIQSSQFLDCSMTNLQAVDVAKEQMARLYYKVATMSRVVADNDDDDAAAARNIAAGDADQHCFTIPLLADIKEHVGNFQWPNDDSVSLSRGGEAKSWYDHSTKVCTPAIMATDTYCPNQSVGTTSPAVIADIIHMAMCKKDFNVEARTAEWCKPESGMTTMIGADGSLYQVQVLRRLATEEAKKIRTMPSTLFSQAPPRSMVSPPAAPCSLRRPETDDERATSSNKHDDDDNNDSDDDDVGIVVAEQKEESQQVQGKQEEKQR